MSEARLFTVVLIVAALSAIFFGWLAGRFVYRDFSQDAGLMAYHKTATYIAKDFSFHSKDMLFEESIRRPPGYPLFLVLIYKILGERLYAIWTAQMLLWLLSIVLLWRISARFLFGKTALLPPLLFALWWGGAVQIFVLNVEILTFFLTLFFVFSFVRWREQHKILWLVAGAVALAFLILTKAAFLYLVPCLISVFIWIERPLSRKVFFGGIVALGALLVLVGSWSLYSFRVFGTWQLASGALTVMRRADDVQIPIKRLGTFFVASIAGDYIADQFFPGYAANPEPLTKETILREKAYERKLLPDKSNDVVLQRETMQEAITLIKKSPIKFLFTGTIYIFRLHMPMSYTGHEISRLFIGTHSNLSAQEKTAIILVFVASWYIFVVSAWIGMIRIIKRIRWPEGKNWAVIVLLILYTNAIYALLSHAEARYLFPVMPFYFLLFSVFAVSLFKRFRYA